MVQTRIILKFEYIICYIDFRIFYNTLDMFQYKLWRCRVMAVSPTSNTLVLCFGFVFGGMLAALFNTVDGRNPAPPGMCESL